MGPAQSPWLAQHLEVTGAAASMVLTMGVLWGLERRRARVSRSVHIPHPTPAGITPAGSLWVAPSGSDLRAHTHTRAARSQFHRQNSTEVPLGLPGRASLPVCPRCERLCT